MPVRVPRLPGIRFEVVEPPRDDLPRMDVAVFAGFASSGPLHLPVPVEDMAEYSAIFGGEVPLAYDDARGTHITAYLPQAVRAFFRNGGRRCWVIRVANERAAKTNCFEIPGLWETVGASDLREVRAEARSPGSWSDNLRVAAVLRPASLTCLTVGHYEQPHNGEPPRIELAVSGGRDLAPGDLLRATFDTPESSPPDDILGYMVVVERIAAEPLPPLPGESPLESPPGATWVTGPAWIFGSAPDSPLGSPVDSPLHSPLELSASPTPSELWQNATLITNSFDALPLVSPSSLERLTFDLIVRDGNKEPERLRRLGFAPEHPRYWASLPSDERLFRTADEPQADTDDEDEARTAPSALWREAAQPRFPLCGRTACRVVYLPIGMNSVEASPLNAPEGCATSQPTMALPASSSPAWAVVYTAADRLPGTPLERSGLGDFCTELFLDHRLATVGNDRLLAEGAFIRYEAATTSRLTGIHAVLLGPEEVSLIAAPDAVHRRWHVCPQSPRVTGSELPLEPVLPAACTSTLPGNWGVDECVDNLTLPTPRLVAPTKVEWAHAANRSTASYWITWSAVPCVDIGYVLEEASYADFLGSRQVYTGPRTAATMSGRENGVRYYRVRALATAGASPWSQAVQVRVDPTAIGVEEEPGGFSDCSVLPAPRWAVDPVEPRPISDTTLASDINTELASYKITWEAVPGADAGYWLEVATREDFSDALRVTPDLPTGFTAEERTEGVYFYRVRAIGTTATSGWSSTLRVRVEPVESSQLLPWTEADAGELTKLHQAILRLCAARGDLLAVLSLPRHSLEEEAIAFGDRLAVTPEERTSSFGALFHPWLIGRGGELVGPLQETPPDGAICGQIAQRTLAFGAWFAPANEPLADVLALTPALAPARRLDLQEAGVNVVRHEPRGFLLLSANTLARDDELRPINVRRLLILLRRLALRRGARYVFEPNSAAFRRLVQRGFEATLDDLFVRGAFAGETPDSSYQVDTGPGLNTAQSVEAGRFIVELRVAPSRPLTFITVRLVQTEDRALAVLER